MLDAIVSYRYIWDTLDIVIVALILYYILNVIEGTRAAQILLGLTVVFFSLFLFPERRSFYIKLDT